jgi:hypothetical protein
LDVVLDGVMVYDLLVDLLTVWFCGKKVGGRKITEIDE